MPHRKTTRLVEAARALSLAREATHTLMFAVAESCAQLLADSYGETVSITMGRNVIITRTPTRENTR